MAKAVSFKTDIKIILRDPILILFFVLPITIPIIFKFLTTFLTPIVYEYLDLTKYYGYILSLGILMTPITLGTVAGFLMIDERDSKIQELIRITPIGYTGYLRNRLILPFIGSMVYTILAYIILDIYAISLIALVLICILSGIEGVLIGYFLHLLAEDKVQGLTYSKGFGVLQVLALADLLNIRWLSVIAGVTPFYWITRLIVDFSLPTVLLALIVHMIYLFVVIKLK